MNAVMPPFRARILHTMAWTGKAGHVLFAWDDEDSGWVIPMIQEKIKEGYRFWIVEKSLTEDHRRQILSTGDLRGRREILIDDKDARDLFEQGKIGIVQAVHEGEYRAVRPSTDPAEIARNDSVAHRPLRAG